MQLYILSRDPLIAAQKIPDKYKFKMLIELGQLVCSAGLSKVYKPIVQGKELQEWIKKYPWWIYKYASKLYTWSDANINMRQETFDNLTQIFLNDLWEHCMLSKEICVPTHAHFRYAKDYQCEIPSKTLLPIEQCVEEYSKYVQWKMKG